MILKSKQKLIGQTTKIIIWIIAFTVMFLNENFNYVLTEYIDSLTYSANMYIPKSNIKIYIQVFEIILISIPLIFYIVFFYRNIDNIFTKVKKVFADKLQERRENEK